MALYACHGRRRRPAPAVDRARRGGGARRSLARAARDGHADPPRRRPVGRATGSRPVLGLGACPCRARPRRRRRVRARRPTGGVQVPAALPAPAACGDGRGSRAWSRRSRRGSRPASASPPATPFSRGTTPPPTRSGFPSTTPGASRPARPATSSRSCGASGPPSSTGAWAAATSTSATRAEGCRPSRARSSRTKARSSRRPVVPPCGRPVSVPR